MCPQTHAHPQPQNSPTFFITQFLTRNTPNSRMEEIEVKILEINRKQIEEKLLQTGAKKILDTDIQTIFFDFEGEPIKRQKMC